MHKHNRNYLIAATLLASMLVSGPVMADTGNVSVYGVANVSYDFIRTGTATAGTQ